MDSIDTLIIERLGEHQRKIDFVRQNLKKCEHDHLSLGKPTYIIMSVAACIAIIWAVSPVLFKDASVSSIEITPPSFEGYRGAGDNDIEQLINAGEYEAALVKVESELAVCENEFAIMHTAEATPEEMNYIKSLYEAETEELMWCKIYLLAKLGEKDALKRSCVNYLNNNNLTTHREEVEKILKKIQ